MTDAVISEAMLRNMSNAEVAKFLNTTTDPLLKHLCERMMELSDDYEEMTERIKGVCDKAEQHYEDAYTNITATVKVPVENIISIIE